MSTRRYFTCPDRSIIESSVHPADQAYYEIDPDWTEVAVIGLHELPDVAESHEFDGEYHVGDLDDFPDSVEVWSAEGARNKALAFLAVARFIEQRDAAAEDAS